MSSGLVCWFMSLFCYLVLLFVVFCFFFFKQKTAYEMRISDWSSDVCSSDLEQLGPGRRAGHLAAGADSAAVLDLRPPDRRAQHQAGLGMMNMEIGRASCRERVCQYV